MLELYSEPNADIFIRCQLGASDTGLYPRTYIYSIDSPSTVYDTVDLAELSNGLYGAKWNVGSIKGKYFTQTLIFTDAGHTTQSPVDRPDSDSINVGRYQGGGYIAPNQGFGVATKAVRTNLTDDEINKVAAKVFELLKPELDKKSELKKSDITIPIQKDYDNNFNNLLMELKGLTPKDYDGNFNVIKDTIISRTAKDYDGYLNDIKNNISQLGKLLQIVKEKEVDLSGIMNRMEELRDEIKGIETKTVRVVTDTASNDETRMIKDLINKFKSLKDKSQRKLLFNKLVNEGTLNESLARKILNYV